MTSEHRLAGDPLKALIGCVANERAFPYSLWVMARAGPAPSAEQSGVLMSTTQAEILDEHRATYGG